VLCACATVTPAWGSRWPAWCASVRQGWAENTTCKRVLVKFADGSERVIEILDDLGMRPDDIPAIKARLRRQGVTNFVDVKLYE
jgi:hypothetical protein